MAEYYPAKWHKELEIFRNIKSLILLEGNIHDSYQYPADGEIPAGSVLRLPEYLHYFFRDRGYENIIFYDAVQGFSNPYQETYTERFSSLIAVPEKQNCIPAPFKSVHGEKNAPCLIHKAVSQTDASVVVIMNYVSRYLTSPEQMQQSETDSFNMLFRASLESRDVRTEKGILRNLIIMLTDKINDLPAWFYLHNPNAKAILLTPPSREEREMLVKGAGFPSFFSSSIWKSQAGYYQENPRELEKIQDRFVALTDGFSFTELNGLRKLCKKEQFSVSDMCDVIDLYKYGIRENPWKKLDISSLRHAEEDFRERVKGQEYALVRTLDIIKRAVTGLSGIQGNSHTRPRGVLFFAGPTGTGKTETAKALAEKLFGDESACIRFDMSEYSQSHSDQKLLGAPPGYVGYEAGGQLTNAIKNNPFSILLFDEIEKAHPSVLDKFLQILEDGRMTDGQGSTVYFSECVIIFTSNLGIYTMDTNGERHQTVSPQMPYSEIRQRVRSAIETYFKSELGRPEILNRIGENIVVYDFIRPDAAEAILKAKLAKIRTVLASEKKILLTVSEPAFCTLKAHVLGNLENGGRGVGNVVESLLINPLSRWLFDNGIWENASVTVEEICTQEEPVSVRCSGGESA